MKTWGGIHQFRATFWVLLLGLLWPMTPSWAQDEAAWESLVELRLGRARSATLFAWQTDDGKFLLPALEVARMAELRVSSDADGSIQGFHLPHGIPFGFDVLDSSAWRGPRKRPLAPGELLLADGELFVEAGMLAWSLGIAATFDPSELIVRFDPVESLPVGQRLQRLASRDDLNQATDRSPALAAPSPRELDGLTVDWRLSQAHELRGWGESNYGLEMGTRVERGALDLGLDGGFDRVLPNRFRASYQRVQVKDIWLRQLRLGSVQGTGPSPRAVHGFAAGNQPWLRSPRFGSRVLEGQLEEGWEVELWRNGELLGWQRAENDGEWSFELPLDYGSNPVELRYYGPDGELRVEHRAQRIEANRLPAGRSEFGFSAGALQSDTRYWSVRSDWRHGAGPFLTTWFFHESIFSGVELPKHRPGLGAALELPGPFHGGFLAERDGRQQLTLEMVPSASFQANFLARRGRDMLLAIDSEDQWRPQAHIFWRPSETRRSRFLETRLEADGRGGSRQLFSLQDRWRRLRWRSGLDMRRGGTLTGDVFEMQVSTVLRTPQDPWLNGIFLRMEAHRDISGGILDEYSVHASRRIGAQARFEIGGGWSEANGGFRMQFGIQLITDRMQAHTRMNRNSQGGSSNSTLEGSLHHDHERGQWEAYPNASLGRSGLRGRVFLDRNANGVRDSGEHGIAGVKILAGGIQTRTDVLGFYEFWDLPSWVFTEIEIDPSSLGDPRLIPASAAHRIELLPNGRRELMIPVLMGREIEGRVVSLQGDQWRPQPRVPFQLVPAARGGSLLNLRSWEDGSFYGLPLVPGAYRVEIDPGLLARRGLRQLDSLRIHHVPPGSDAAWQLELKLEAIEKELVTAHE